MQRKKGIGERAREEKQAEEPREMVQEGSVAGVAIGEQRGVSKAQAPFVELIEGYGVRGDGHAGTAKQVSLVALEDIERMNSAHGLHACIGDFAENIATRGIDLTSLAPGDEISVGPALLRVVRLGKSPEEMKHHTFSFQGHVLLPQKGLFCEVIRGGRVKPEDAIKVRRRLR